jgi:hypothetical protein
MLSPFDPRYGAGANAMFTSQSATILTIFKPVPYFFNFGFVELRVAIVAASPAGHQSKALSVADVITVREVFEIV